MPTPVAAARQCLTPEAAAALDEAVAVARRRAHSQTTSLHAVSAFLSLPSSLLRDACLRTRNSAYYPTRVQIKALELSLSVSLDRQPAGLQTSKRVEDPPVSNSFMAAIKRSQANQRRNPENFHIYQDLQQHQHPSSSSSLVSCIKVELKHLILSILDDPVVSRVFSDAGFRSCDVKLAIVRPLPHLLRYPHTRGPPLFLCNFGEDSDLDRRAFPFPFPGFSDAGDDCRRIGELLAKGRSPLLVGASAKDVLRGFSETLEAKNHGVLPLKISGLSSICVDKEILEFVSGNRDVGFAKSRFEEVGRIAEHCLGHGLIVNYGDLEVLVCKDDASFDAVSFVVVEMTRLLKVHGGKVWLLGAAESYETYLMFLNRFPSIEKEWVLQLLHITSLRPSIGQSHSRSSFTESFVPFGGFFPTLLDLEDPLRSSNHCFSRCQQCKNCEQEQTVLSKGFCKGSISDQYQSSLPSWLQLTEFGVTNRLDVVQARDGLLLNAKVAGLDKIWNHVGQSLPPTPLSDTEVCQMDSQVPVPGGCHFINEDKKHDNSHTRNNISDSRVENACEHVNSCISMGLPKKSTAASDPSAAIPTTCEVGNANFVHRLQKKPSVADFNESDFQSPCSLSNSSVGDTGASLSTLSSVTVDLELGIPACSNRDPRKPVQQTSVDFLQTMQGCKLKNADLSIESVAHNQSLPLSYSSLGNDGQFGAGDFKAICSTLTKRVNWQNDAVTAICQTIARHYASKGKYHGASLRRDLWFNFLGPDRFGKNKIATALAEIVFGSRKNLISVDLGSPGGIKTGDANYFRDISRNNLKHRGSTISDYIAMELKEKPSSVIFLENVDKADVLVQNTLSHAIKTGKFPDSHGKEIGSKNAIFIATSNFEKGDNTHFWQEDTHCSDERLLGVKSWSMQISVERDTQNNTLAHNSNSLFTPSNGTCVSPLVNKRKLMGCAEIIQDHGTSEVTKRVHKAAHEYLDLNLPADNNEVHGSDHGDLNLDPASKSWLEEFFALVDETVVFKPLDLDALAYKVMKDVKKSFRENVSSECSLEIDSKVLEQMVAVACQSDSDRVVDDWVEQILARGFAEACERHNLTAHSVVKLATVEGHCVEAQAPEVCLPARVFVNPNPLNAVRC